MDRLQRFFSLNHGSLCFFGQGPVILQAEFDVTMAPYRVGRVSVGVRVMGSGGRERVLW